MAERRPNREGKIWQRASDGRYAARAYPPEDSGGQPRMVYGRTREEVKTKRKALEDEMAAGMPGSPDQTVAEFFDRWLNRTLRQEVAADRLAASTLDSYRDNAQKHILPDLGAIQLRRLSVPRVRDWLYDLSVKPSARTRRKPRRGESLPAPKPLSPRTVIYCHAILRRALNDARREELIRRNVATLVKPPRNTAQERTPLTKDETARLLAAAEADRWWCYWLVVLTLGLRRGEALGLRWRDVDFDARTVTIQGVVQRVRTGPGHGKLIRKPPKTAGSSATLPVGDGILGALREWQRQQRKLRMQASAWLDADLVFTTNIGTAIEPRNVNRAWARICVAAGVEARLHDLRHACGTYLADAGVHQKAIQTTLRHSRMAATEIYVHALEEMNRTAAETMDAIVTDLRRSARSTT